MCSHPDPAAKRIYPRPLPLSLPAWVMLLRCVRLACAGEDDDLLWDRSEASSGDSTPRDSLLEQEGGENLVAEAPLRRSSELDDRILGLNSSGESFGSSFESSGLHPLAVASHSADEDGSAGEAAEGRVQCSFRTCVSGVPETSFAELLGQIWAAVNGT